jgi:hypothetical protein
MAEAIGCMEVMRERERSGRKKGQAWVLYPLMFIGPTHQPMNISGLAYVAAVVPPMNISYARWFLN